jgi:hypothetical protein
MIASRRNGPGAGREHGANLAITLGMTEATNESGHVDFSSLAQLRDEIRVRLHLAHLDAKDKWQDLETQLASLEHRLVSEGGSVLGSTAQLARELKQSLLDFRTRLHEPEKMIPGASTR